MYGVKLAIICSDMLFGEMQYQSTEIISFVSRDFPQYTWSLQSLDRRLRHFEIFYMDYNVEVADVQQAVAKELDGPGKLLGYCTMHKKVCQVHQLNVPRKLVNEVMYDLDPKVWKNVLSHEIDHESEVTSLPKE